MTHTQRLASLRKGALLRDLDIIRVAITTGQKSLAKTLAQRALDRIVTRLGLVEVLP